MQEMGLPDARSFEGTWKLLPERCVYEHTIPAREGTYRIAATPEGLAFTLDWISSTGSVEHTDFRLTWDAETPASLELVDSRTLNTTVEHEDQVVGHASRRLSEDGNEMEIVQRAFTPEGKPFVNRAWYRKLG
jgi:hypothetical protein